MSEYKADDWHHPWLAPGVRTAPDGGDRGIAHRRQLLVDERDWAVTKDALNELQVGWDYDGEMKYGLVRLVIADSYEAVVHEGGLLDAVQHRIAEDRRVGLGRNRLLAPARLEFDDQDLQSSPKVVPSDVGTAILARQALAPRTQFERGAGVRVGVVDTAFFGHPYSEGSCLYRPADPSAAYDGGDLGVAAGHATFVSGLILQLAPGAVVMAQDVVQADAVADMVKVHDAICALADAGAQVINLSLGCVTNDEEEPFVLRHAIDWVLAAATRAQRPAPVLVAASGNNATGAQNDKRFWPAADSRVTAVAAATRDGESWKVADYSGRGSWVDVAAPGDNILSTRASFSSASSYAYWSGTSFATAVISGLVAAQISETGSSHLDQAEAVPIPLSAGGPTVLPVYGTKAVIIKP